LDLPFILTKLVSYMNPLVQNKPKKGMVVQIMLRSELCEDMYHLPLILKGSLSV
jgi:hypothetical protein